MPHSAHRTVQHARLAAGEDSSEVSCTSRPPSVFRTSQAACSAMMPTGDAVCFDSRRGAAAKTAAAMTPTMASGIPPNTSTASRVLIVEPRGR